jgi:hypothetical protein
MNWKHIAQLVLSPLVVVLVWLASPKGSEAIVSAIATIKAIETLLGLTSPAMGKQLPPTLPLLVLMLVGCGGCSGARSQAAVGPSVDLGVCILEHVAVDVAAGKPWDQAVQDTAIACRSDAGAVLRVVAAHRKAEVLEGFVPRPIDAGAGQ